jgi:hypothetical protein
MGAACATALGSNKFQEGMCAANRAKRRTEKIKRNAMREQREDK